MDIKTYNKILIATDGSENARKAAGSGIAIAAASGAHVYALYVMEMDAIGITPEAVHRDCLAAMEVAATEHMTNEQWRELARLADANRAMERKKHLNEKGKNATDHVVELGCSDDVEVSSLIEEGHPAAVIVDMARDLDVDLIVIGTMGMTADGRFLLGSIADKVIRNSKIEVLVVR